MMNQDRIPTNLFKETNENIDSMQARFNEVVQELQKATPLNFTHVGYIFGQEFWQLLTMQFSNVEFKGEQPTINLYIPKR